MPCKKKPLSLRGFFLHANTVSHRLGPNDPSLRVINLDKLSCADNPANLAD